MVAGIPVPRGVSAAAATEAEDLAAGHPAVRDVDNRIRVRKA